MMTCFVSKFPGTLHLGVPTLFLIQERSVIDETRFTSNEVSHWGGCVVDPPVTWGSS